MEEKEIAIKEANIATLQDAYFEARPNIDNEKNRKIFDAGFHRGWDKARPKYPFGLSSDQIKTIADCMPGGLEGFCKGWGWEQFARAIEEAHGICD